MTPTQRTYKRLKELGLKYWNVEKFNPYAGPHGQRQDLFGIIDIIALHPEGVLGIQSAGQAFSEHFKKITIEKRQHTIDWLKTPGTMLELWAWRKLKKKRGGKAMKWEPRIKVFTLEDFE